MKLFLILIIIYIFIVLFIILFFKGATRLSKELDDKEDYMNDKGNK